MILSHKHDLCVSADEVFPFVFQLMKCFSVMPMDQHLTLNGIPLTEDEATLISLGIRPGSLLLLKVCCSFSLDVVVLSIAAEMPERAGFFDLITNKPKSTSACWRCKQPLPGHV